MPLGLVACSSLFDFQTSFTILIISGKSQGSGPCWHPGLLPREEGSTPSVAGHLLPSSAEWKYRSSTGILPRSPEEEAGLPPPLLLWLLLLLLPPPEGNFFPGSCRRTRVKSSPALERQASSSLAQLAFPAPAQNTGDETRPDAAPRAPHC